MLPSVLDLLVPPRCLACGRRAPLPFCHRCASEARPTGGGCRRCAGPARPGHPCWAPDAPVRGLVAAYDYRGPVAAAVVTAKVRGARAGWASLGALLATHVAAAAPTVDAVTWVTTAPARRRLRGVDHAAVLARHVARALGLPAVEALRVTREGGEERFVCRSELPGTDLLLVDDVVTTGTTARRAAEALVAGGAAPPWIAALARAGAHPLGERL